MPLKGQKVSSSGGVSASYSKIFHVRDEKASSTNGGTLTAGAWRTHDFTQEVTNEIPGASRIGNIARLTTPGIYVFKARFVTFTCSVVQGRVQDVTNNITKGIGINVYSIASQSTVLTVVEGQFELNALTDFELQAYSAGSQAATGFGIPLSIGPEVYADMIFKLKEVA
jgi:hypothetical protein